jgi:ElaB/YqjD/DUF883 family membrane-anchored ribosome-binding protein
MAEMNPGQRGGEGTQRDGRSGMPEIRERLSDVKEDVRALASTTGQAALQQLDPLEEYVRKNPIRALLIAGGVGIVLGMILRK